MTPAHCFLLELEAIKWPSEKTSIFGEVYLFSDTVVCAFSEAAFGEILASIRLMFLCLMFLCLCLSAPVESTGSWLHAGTCPVFVC